MNGATFCSGIGAPEMAAPWIDWRLASEIEDFPRAVLQDRFGYLTPNDHNQGDPLLWSDMTEVTPDLIRSHGLPLPDLIVAGTPCQAFSVAGLRKGTADARGNLTLTFVEICHAIVDARPDGCLTVLWENVPGVLSDKGNAFGAFLGGLVGADDALLPSDRKWGFRHKAEFFTEEGDEDGETRSIEKASVGGTWGWQRIRWPGQGMVAGPRARVAWGIRDAQYFGLAQRRRRVFAVISFGDGADPAAVLFERKGLQGDTPPRREAGEGAAPTISARPTRGGGLGTDTELDGGLIASHDPATTLTARERKGALPEADLSTVIAHTLSAEGFDASEDGTGRGTPIVPVAFDCKGTEVQTDQTGTVPTLRAMGHARSHQNAGGQLAVAFAQNQRGELRTSDVSPQLTTGGGKPGEGYPAMAEPYTLAQRGRDGEPSIEYRQDGTSNAILTPNGGRAGMGVGAIATPWAVRRLTPVECHRLQGFPDDHCDIPWRGKDHAPDGRQYKALGNSMAVPVLAWLLERIGYCYQVGPLWERAA